MYNRSNGRYSFSLKDHTCPPSFGGPIQILESQGQDNWKCREKQIGETQAHIFAAGQGSQESASINVYHESVQIQCCFQAVR